MTCPCEKPDGTASAYDCEHLGCRMTPRYCGMYQTRPDYRQAWDEGRGPGQVVKTHAARDAPNKCGPGTELKRLLKRLFIRDTGGCGCNAMAAKMNRWGCDGCRESDHRAEILDCMAKEAAKRKYLPFVRIAADGMLEFAIKIAEKKEKKRG